MMTQVEFRAGLLASHFFFLAAAFSFAAPTLASDTIPQRCTKCHTEAAVMERVVKMPAKERRTKLESFLSNHFAPDSAERSAIVKALSEKAGKSP